MIAAARRLAVASALLLLAAACTVDRTPEGGAAAASGAAGEEAAAEAPQPVPAETRALRERLEAESRAALPDEPAPPRPPARPAPETYDDCMREAAGAASPEERALLEQGCRPLPGGPRTPRPPG